MIKFENVTKTYQTGETHYQALKGITFDIEKGEVVSIVGPSGSGKSTAMNIIGLLDKPTSGKYYLSDEDTFNFDSNEQAFWRNKKIGFIFQSFFLLPRMTALQNVMLPLQYSSDQIPNVKELARQMLERVEMEKFAHHRPNELSGGQKQRVAIARALVTNPAIILADEPTGALDSKTSDIVLDLLLSQAVGTTIIIITHDMEIAEKSARILEIRDGVIRREVKK